MDLHAINASCHLTFPDLTLSVLLWVDTETVDLISRENAKNRELKT